MGKAGFSRHESSADSSGSLFSCHSYCNSWAVVQRRTRLRTDFCQLFEVQTGFYFYSSCNYNDILYIDLFFCLVGFQIGYQELAATLRAVRRGKQT
jgi:hypothetical protein